MKKQSVQKRIRIHELLNPGMINKTSTYKKNIKQNSMTHKIDIKVLILYPAVFVGGLILFTLLLTAVAAIPRSCIREHMLESAEFLNKGEDYFNRLEGIESSKADYYADSILLSIAWYYDGEHPLQSVMWSSYYKVRGYEKAENLLEAITNEHEPNSDYLRYWHGSNVIVKPFHIIGNIRQLYILHAVILIILTAVLVYLLISNRLVCAAVSLAAGLIGVSIWFVPSVLEYYWMFAVMLISSIISLKLVLKNRYRYLGIVFMEIGMVTAYLDFLTTELITLLIPLLLVLYAGNRIHHRQGREGFWNMLVLSFSWGFGYLGTWAMKWGIAAAVLKTNTLPYVEDNIHMRIDGEYYTVSGAQMIMEALKENIKCIFPFEYGAAGALGVVVLLIAIAYVIFVYRRKGADAGLILCYILIGLLPYIRYMVLHNHSYRHYFFTYRAQMAGIMTAGLIIGELTQYRNRLKS